VRRREDEIEDACVQYMVASRLAGNVGTEVPWEGGRDGNMGSSKVRVGGLGGCRET